MTESNGHSLTDRIGCDSDSDKYILVVDIGTTNIRAHIYDKRSRLIEESSSSIQLLSPRIGFFEISSQSVWTAFVESVRKVIEKAKISATQILCLGISTQRGTFITWDRKTGEPFHEFITWKDIRSDNLCKQWNESFKMKFIKLGAKFIHFFTRSNRFLAASLLKMTTGMVIMRLVWVLQNIPQIRLKAVEGDALYGTLDTYLVWKLTEGKVHATDASNSCITGFYDPFLMKWADWAMHMFNIPPSMLPIVKDTNGDFGRTSAQLFGASIPIRAVVGDQQAAMFGECCFREGDVKCTLGTGTFIDINTGDKPFASYKGLYPIVGWKLENEKSPTYLIEGASYDTGTTVTWAQKIGLFDDPKESSDLAHNESNNNNIYFVPAFSGLQAPINDSSAATAFIGITPSTNKAQMVRSILESLCFRVKQMYEIILEEQPNLLLKQFKIDGGVANNDFVVQLIADLTGKKVERATHRDMSSLGAAFLAGLSIGYWTDLKHISSLRQVDKVFLPRDNWKNNYRHKFENWERALLRCLHWNQ